MKKILEKLIYLDGYLESVGGIDMEAMPVYKELLN